MKHWSVRTRITAAFAAVISVTLLLGIIGFIKVAGMRHQAELIERDALPGIFSITQAQVAAKDIFPLIMDQVHSADAAERRDAVSAVERSLSMVDQLEEVYSRTFTTEGERRLYNEMRSAEVRFKDAYHAARADGAVTAVEAQSQIKPAFGSFIVVMDSIAAYNRDLGRSAAAAIVRSTKESERSILMTWIIALVIGSFCIWLLVRMVQGPLASLMSVTDAMRQGDFRQRTALSQRDELGLLGDRINLMADDLTQLIRRVQQSGIQVNSSATEIAATARQQQATASEIAATTAEVGATAVRISATSRELARTMEELSDVAEQTAGLATSGQGGLQRMDTTMRQIAEASGSINARLALLSERAGSIGTIVTTINKVADQTNLLSLNAAIEAEKAGEHGRGFAVVATEIRRLADQTAIATYDIEQIVKEMQSAVSAGVMGMDKFSDEVRRGGEVIVQVTVQLTEIIQQVQLFTPAVDAANDGVQSQATGAQQISEALSQLNTTVQQTADSLRQSNVAIEQLNDAARGLQNGVSRFTLAG
jgi:methyl-accepting chemotaxis protein WspA